MKTTNELDKMKRQPPPGIPVVDPQRVIAKLKKQLGDAAERIAVLETIIESKGENENA